MYFLGGLLANTGLFELSESVLPKVVAACTLAIAALIASMAIAVRRLHDRNKSAWWLLPFFFLPVLVEVPAGFFGVTEGARILSAIGGILSLWGLFELGVRRGTIGFNSYGADPLGIAVADPKVFT